MNNLNLISWLSAQHEVHDASGIENPSLWLWGVSGLINVYYPIEKIDYQLYTGQIYTSKTKEQFQFPCITNEYALQLFNEGVQIWEGNEVEEKLITDYKDLESCFDWVSVLFIELNKNSKPAPNAKEEEAFIKELNEQPVIIFTECDDDSDKYTFSYLCTKNGVLVECSGYMEPYFSGRAIEHNVIIDDSENIEEDDLNNTAQEVEDEITQAFYNHFTK